MRIRYFSFLTIAIAAAYLVVASVAFSLASIPGNALGIGIGTLAVSLGVGIYHWRRPATVAIAAAMALVSAWTIVASQVFALPTVDNLTFASALGLAGLAVGGLVMHELDGERVIHSLSVEPAERDRTDDRARVAA
jgi:hypothetical protein